ncbi:MAG: FadR/GntR family transcriptional regulator [Pseudomonadota bacterium]
MPITRSKAKSARKRPAESALRLHQSIARDLGLMVTSGRVKPGHVLDGEIESSEALQVSRTAYREAVRILSAKGLVESRPKVGTRVTPQERWHLLDPDVLHWIFSGDPEERVLFGVFELRSIVEPGAAALAAMRRSQSHLDSMRRNLDEMARHSLQSKAGRVADQEFHAALLNATGNPFIVSLTNGVTAAVDALTEFKLRAAPLARDPVPDHEQVYQAVVSKDAEAARAAMTELIRLAILDTTTLRKKAKPKRSKHK